MKSAFIVVLLLLSFFVDAQPILVQQSQYPYNLSSNVSLFEDFSAKLSFGQIKNKSFVKNQESRILLPFSNQVTWMKIALKNEALEDSIFYFFIDNTILRKSTLYIENQADSVVFESFKIREFSKIKSSYFQINLKKGESKNFYFKLESQRGVYLILQLYDSQSFNKRNDSSKIVLGFLAGLTCMVIFIVFVIGFLIVKDKKSMIYAIYTLFRAIGFWSSVNVTGSLLSADWMVSEKISLSFMSVSPLISALLAITILPFGKLPKWTKYMTYIFVVINFILLVYLWVYYGPVPLKLLALLTVVSNLFFYSLFIFTLVKKINEYSYYSIPFLLGNFSNLILNLRVLGILYFNAITQFTVFLAILEIAVYVYYLSQNFRASVKSQAEKLKNLGFEAEKATKLEELDRLKTRFFTNISHEFRTPLTLLIGPIEDLQKKYPQESIIVTIQRNLQRLQVLINQLLDLSKLEAGEVKVNPQEIDIATFLRQLFASFESLAQSKNIVFSHSLSHHTLLGLVDADKLEKIVTNLLSNAFKFTQEKRQVTVWVSPSLSFLSGRPEGASNGLSIVVQDTGIGIAASRLPHIFDRFYQVEEHNNQEGTGIGLALVKELVEVLGGKIEVRSQVGDGTTFEVILPYTPLKTLSDSAIDFANKRPMEVDYKGFNDVPFVVQDGLPLMLIVEDNPDLRYYIATIFENKYQIIMANDGMEGLEKAIEYVPDVVISDLMMPKLDGLGFCEKLKTDERTNHIPVVILTAKATISDKLIGLEKGADDYLSKPFNKEELSLRVANLIHQRQLLREKYLLQHQEITPVVETKPKEPTIDELFIQKAQKVIDKHLGQSGFDVEEFANNMNLSSVQLRRKLKAITNQTVTEFVRNYRLELAAQMLKKGEGTVSEIAYRVGFDSMPYFSKVFQEKYGKTASEWR